MQKTVESRCSRTRVTRWIQDIVERVRINRKQRNERKRNTNTVY